MKRLLIAVAILVLLVLAFAVPVLADKGGAPNDNASDKAIGSAYGQAVKEWNATGLISMGEIRSDIAQNDDTPGAANEVHTVKGQPIPGP